VQNIVHLSATDAAFLYLETPEMPMHVASLYHVELPPGYSGDYYEDLKAHLRRRMHVSPIFQRRVETMPLDLTAPVWVECDADMDYHVRRVVLPRPGSLAQLEAYVARLHSSLLDRSRPLWEVYLFEGLETGDMAIYTKVHHCALDGMGSIELVKALLDITPVPREVRRSRHRPQRDIHFGLAEMLRAGVSNGIAQTVKAARVARPALRSAVAMARALWAQRRAGGAGRPGKGERVRPRLFAPRTPLNVTITNQRSFGTLSLPLAEVKEVGKSVGATINDMVMAICAGGLRRYLRETATLPKEPLVAMMPISLREKGNDEMTNMVSGLPVALATDLPDPMKRMFAIRDSLATTKERFTMFRDVMVNDFPFLGMPWIMSALASLYGRARLAESLPVFGNVAISNVVGPQMPLYYAGARVKTYYPVSIVTHGLALNITVVSYSGSIHFGFTACRRAMPDMPDFVEDMRTAYEELKAAIERHLRKAAEEAVAATVQAAAQAAAAAPAVSVDEAAEADAGEAGRSKLRRARAPVAARGGRARKAAPASDAARAKAPAA
jgi:WS/DGAT/MGAT family acyltransferase